MAEARRKNAGPRNSEGAPSALGANESADAGEANNLTSEPQSGAGAAANPEKKLAKVWKEAKPLKWA